MSTYVKITSLLLGMFLVRPSALGEQFTSLGIIMVLFALGIHLLEYLKVRENHFITLKNFNVLIMTILLWVYLLVHALIVGSNHFDFVLKATMTHLIIILTCVVILSHEKSNKVFFKSLIKILLFFSFSYSITFVLSMVLGLGFDRLLLLSIPIEGYETSGNVYFPFTQLYGFMSIGSINLPRGLGFFRESGIFQAFLIWAYFNLKQYNLNSKKNKFLLIIGIFGTFSTAGIAVFFAVYAIKLFLNKRKILSLGLVSIGLYGLFYAPYIGIKSKSITHATSITDRSYATLNGLTKLADNPIGTGLYNTEFFDVTNSGINLLAMSYTIGIIGFILVLAVYFSPLVGYPYKKNYLIGAMPFFITLLISQPILDAPFIYVMLLANYHNCDFKVKENVKSFKKRKWKLKKYKIVW